MPTLHLPPGPKGHFLIGSLWEINRDPLDFFSQCACEYGDVVRFLFGLKPAYLLNHPNLVEEVLVTQYGNFVKSSAYRRGLRILGNGLLTSDGDFWQRQRRLCQPAFHQERIAAYGKIMVAYTNRLLDQWQDGEVRDIHQEMMHLTAALRETWANLGRDAKETVSASFFTDMRGLQDLHSLSSARTRLP